MCCGIVGDMCAGFDEGRRSTPPAAKDEGIHIETHMLSHMFRGMRTISIGRMDDPPVFSPLSFTSLVLVDLSGRGSMIPSPIDLWQATLEDN